MPQCWYKSSRIYFEEGLWLLIRIDFNVLVRNTLEFQGYPYPLDERAIGHSQDESFPKA